MCMCEPMLFAFDLLETGIATIPSAFRSINGVSQLVKVTGLATTGSSIANSAAHS